MLSSLRSRLLAVVVAVGVVAIGATAIIAQQVANDDIRATINTRVEARSRVLEDVAEFVAIQGSWDGIEDLVERIAGRYDERVAIYDARGERIADSDPGAELPTYPVGLVAPRSASDAYDVAVASCETPVPVDDGTVVGAASDVATGAAAIDVCLTQAFSEASAETAGLVFIGGADEAASVLGSNGPNERIVIVAVVVLLGAVVVMAFALRPVLAPIGALQVGARRLEGGHLDTRVPETGATELAELARSFNAMAAALQADKERQQRWTSDTAHELRNPVQNLRGHLEAARDGLMVPDGEWLDSMLDETGQLGHLVADLSVLTLSDAGQVRLLRQDVDLGVLAADIVASHRPRATLAEVDLVATGSAVVDGDERRLRQVISNLVDNALRHTPAGGAVTVEVAEAGDSATVRVVDTGDGIPADAQDRIFDRFARVDEHRSRGAGGSGLGLSIVSVLVDAHGGSVSVESQEGAGSTFTLTLPRVRGKVPSRS